MSDKNLKKELDVLFDNYTQFIKDRIVEKYYSGYTIFCIIKGNWAVQGISKNQYTLASYTLVKNKYLINKFSLECNFKNLEKEDNSLELNK